MPHYLPRPLPGGYLASGAAVENLGHVNVAMFDGSSRTMNDRISREPEWWYPTGTVIVNPGEGMTTTAAGQVLP